MLLPINRMLYFGFRTESFNINRVKVNIKTWVQYLSDPKYSLRLPGNSCITLWVFAFYFLFNKMVSLINTSKFKTNLKVIIFLKMGTFLLNILEIINKIFSVVVVQYFRRWIPNNTVSQKVTVLFFSKLHAKGRVQKKNKKKLWKIPY